MATYLTVDALITLGNSQPLQDKVAPYVGVKALGLKSAIIRNSKSLTTYKAVVIISQNMGKAPEEILTELND